MTPKEMPSVAPANSKKASMSSVSAWAPRPRPRLGPRLRPPGTPRMRPGELHDLALMCFGLALRARGSRIAFLGADSPLDTLMRTAGDLQPDVMSSQPPPRSGSRECVPTCVSWAGRGGSPLPARARHKPSQRRSAPSSSTVTRSARQPMSWPVAAQDDARGHDHALGASARNWMRLGYCDGGEGNGNREHGLNQAVLIRGCSLIATHLRPDVALRRC